MLPAAALREVPDGRFVRTAGHAIVRQRPGTAKGFCFLTLEDETGTCNAVLTPRIFQRFRVPLHTSVRDPEIAGPVQNVDGVIHVRVRELPLPRPRGDLPAPTTTARSGGGAKSDAPSADEGGREEPRMTEPSIKGIALQSVIDDVLRLREEGRIPESMLEARLEKKELAWLEEKVQPALWYAIDGYARLTQLLLEVEGRGDPDYIVRRGEAAGARLFDSGIYVQLQHGEKRGEEARSGGRSFTEHDGRLMTTLSGSMFNFTRWSYRVEGSEAIIEVADAAAFPEVSRLAAQGLIQCITARVRNRKVEVRSERPSPDRVIFRFASS